MGGFSGYAWNPEFNVIISGKTKTETQIETGIITTFALVEEEE